MARFAIAILVLLWAVPGARAGETALANPPPSAAAPRRIVMSLSSGDPARMNAVFNNIDNIRRFYGKERVRIELVAYGDGIAAFLRDGSPVRARVDEAKAEGVRLVACRVSLAAHDKGVADLIRGVGWVPSGLPEIIERRLSGWVYLRP